MKIRTFLTWFAILAVAVMVAALQYCALMRNGGKGGLICFCLSEARAQESGMPKPTGKDKCPVCGMFVTKYPNWTSAILFKNSSPAFFDGPKDMFKYLLEMKRYNAVKKADDIEKIFVMDYYSLTPLDARKAWYVLASDVYGPMGKELIPLAKKTDAQAFMNDHQGKRILNFSDITAEVVKTLE